MKKKLLISFSGGRTSAVMTKLCYEQYRDDFEIVVCFANTGLEHENTLKFVKDVEEHWNIPVVWVEAIVNPIQGKGIRAKVVTFDSACRKGEPMEEAIKKYGIPNKINPHCSGRLKEEVIYFYCREYLGWKRGEWFTAIGIRSDEIDRMSAKAIENKMIYPLVKLGFTVDDVEEYMAKYSFDLDLPGKHYGNCVTCWKKSIRKLCTIAKHNPEAFDFFDEMEKKYNQVKKREGYEEKKFFRENKDTKEILKLSKGDFKEYTESEWKDIALFPPETDLTDWEFWDRESSCSESCEIGGDE